MRSGIKSLVRLWQRRSHIETRAKSAVARATCKTAQEHVCVDAAILEQETRAPPLQKEIKIAKDRACSDLVKAVECGP